MNARGIWGKAVQLSELPVSLWAQFIKGWLGRSRIAVVPCVLPQTHRSVLVPLADFYESYSFFSESRRGRSELRFFLDQLRPGDVVYDIGAFRGVYGVATKTALGDATTVHLFEPVARNRRGIDEIARLNRLEGFIVIDRAVGRDENIKGVLDQTSGMLRQRDSTNMGSFMDIPSVSVDSYIEHSSAPPTVMKIDVEGFELEVLHGAEYCLRQTRPRLWLELHPGILRSKGCDWKTAIEFLKSTGYGTINFYSDKELPTRDRGFHVWCAP